MSLACKIQFELTEGSDEINEITEGRNFHSKSSAPPCAKRFILLVMLAAAMCASRIAFAAAVIVTDQGPLTLTEDFYADQCAN